DPTATRYDHLTYRKVLSDDLGVMDHAAVALARENHIPIIVFSIAKAGAMAEVVKGEGIFTKVSE
ncbi:MAG: UMP kinase, partial [Alphaproteobacteria bacterium]